MTEPTIEVCDECGGPNCSTSTTVITVAEYESIDRCSHCERTWDLSPCEDCKVLTCGACWENVGCMGCAQCRTEGCDGDPNTGDSYDGYCPSCADRTYGSED